jgi:hypothetical protein
VGDPLKPCQGWADVSTGVALVKIWRDWAEEHWMAVGMVLSVGGALAIAVILAMAFNVITTRVHL